MRFDPEELGHALGLQVLAFFAMIGEQEKKKREE